MIWTENTLIYKDPDSVKDWVFDWSDWLGADTISSYVISVSTGLTLDSDSNDTTSVTVWLSGGTVGSTYTVACKITTAAGRVDERSVKFKAVQK